jgi:hypothetical protein
LQSITPEVFSVLSGIYLDKVRVWRSFLEGNGDDEGGALSSVEDSLLALKVLRRLVIAGYEFPNRASEVVEFWNMTREQFATFAPQVLRPSANLSETVYDLLQKHVMQFSKLHLDLATQHTAAFALLPDAVGLVQSYWSLITELGESFGINPSGNSDIESADATEDKKPLIERLALKGLLLLRQCVRTVHSPFRNIRIRQQQEKDEQTQATSIMKDNLLTTDMVIHIVEITVTKFFVFTRRDLAEWQEDPEEWEKTTDSEGEGWEFVVRSCAEKLFMDLTINYKDMLVQPLLAVFGRVSCK